MDTNNVLRFASKKPLSKEGEFMTQDKKREYLITELLNERPEYADISIPKEKAEQKKLLRALFNIRLPLPISDDFITIQDEYLREETRQKGITSIDDLESIKPDIYLWQGDITTLKCDAIVNAANSQMLGCFCPNHGCIDNAVHTFSGVQLRLKCAEMMQKQGKDEEIGKAKITPAYNLPCKYILHTVGPIVTGKLTEKDCELLRSCYRSCLARIQAKQRCVLLHIHRRTSFSKRQGGKNRNRNSQRIQKADKQ